MEKKICGTCGHIGKPTLRTKGSTLFEIVLWCMLVLPGLIYSIWRHLSRDTVCQACGSTELLPLDSPRGRRMAIEYGLESELPRPRRRLGDAVVNFLNNSP